MGNYGAPPASAAEEYGAPAADNYGGPSDNYDYDYNDTPAQAPNSYEAAQPASDTYLAADDPLQSPSAQASDIYDAPGPAGGYSAPSAQAAGGYSAPASSYQASRRGRKFNRPQTLALPRRSFRG